MSKSERHLQPSVIDYKNVVSDLLDSATLDKKVEGGFTLELFDHYDWQMRPGCDPDEFAKAKQEFADGLRDVDDLDDFMAMVYEDGQHDTYFLIWQARQLTKGIRPNNPDPHGETPWGDLSDYERTRRVHHLVSSLTPEQCGDLVEYKQKRETEQCFEPDDLFQLLDWITGVEIEDPGLMA